MTDISEQKQIHFNLVNVGLRAQATAAGFVQLCKELQQAGVLDDEAAGRIKSVIADEIMLTAPRHVNRQAFREEARDRLDRIFAGEQTIGDASELNYSGRE